MTKILRCLATLAAISFMTTPVAGQSGAAAGLGVNVPVIGRLIGSGTLFISTVDIANHAAATRVDFYVDGVDMATGVSVSANGSISGSGALVPQGSGAVMPGAYTARYDDFVESLVAAGLLPEAVRANGFLGSVLFVFDGFRFSGQGSVTARFYSALADGTVGVSLKGHEMTTREPQQLVASLVDTRSATGSGPKLYPNVFINNTGIPAAGAGPAGPVTVVVSARSNGAGEAIGTPLTVEIAPGHTIVVGQVFDRLRIPPGAGSTILVYVTVTAGSCSIAGVVSQVDDGTRDGSVFSMSRADF